MSPPFLQPFSSGPIFRLTECYWMSSILIKSIRFQFNMQVNEYSKIKMKPQRLFFTG
jgi:hypothetical protein